MAWKKQYTPEERAEYERRKQQELESMVQKIDEGVQQVFSSDKEVHRLFREKYHAHKSSAPRRDPCGFVRAVEEAGTFGEQGRKRNRNNVPGTAQDKSVR